MSESASHLVRAAKGVLLGSRPEGRDDHFVGSIPGASQSGFLSEKGL